TAGGAATLTSVPSWPSDGDQSCGYELAGLLAEALVLSSDGTCLAAHLARRIAMNQQASLSTLFGMLALGAATVVAPLTSFEAKAHDHDKEGQHKKEKVELEGTVSQVTGSCPNLRFTIADTEVVAKDKTTYEDGSCNDVASGKRVEVKGKMNEDGTLRAWKVDFESE